MRVAGEREPLPQVPVLIVNLSLARIVAENSGSTSRNFIFTFLGPSHRNLMLFSYAYGRVLFCLFYR